MKIKMMDGSIYDTDTLTNPTQVFLAEGIERSKVRELMIQSGGACYVWASHPNGGWQSVHFSNIKQFEKLIDDLNKFYYKTTNGEFEVKIVKSRKKKKAAPEPIKRYFVGDSIKPAQDKIIYEKPYSDFIVKNTSGKEFGFGVSTLNE